MATEPRAWVVRGGSKGESDPLFLSDNLVGIGFSEWGDLSAVGSREAIKARALQVLPDAKEASAFNYAAQAWAFRGRIEVGDLVVVPLKNTQRVAIGRVTGDYKYVDDGLGSVHHTRAVEWLRTDIPRTVIGKDLLYSLGA